MSVGNSILLYEEKPQEIIFIRNLISQEKSSQWQLLHFENLSQCVRFLNVNTVDIILLHFPQPERKQHKILKRISAAAPQCPLIVLADESGLEETIEICGSNVQDFLTTGKYSFETLIRSVNHAIELKQTSEALRQSEERFSVMEENVVDIIYQMDLSMRFTYITPSVTTMFGYTQEEWIGSYLSDHCSGKAFRQMAGIIARSLKEIATFKDITFETEMIRKDGSEFPVEILGRIILNENKIPVGLQGVTRDITERKRMQNALEEERNLLARRVAESTAALRQTNAELLQALKIKDDFLANMSHELRTPLTAILGLSEMLELNFDCRLDEHQVESIQQIHNSGKHLLNLINDVLDISRIQAGKMILDPAEVVVEDICRASLSLVRGIAKSKEQTLDLKMDDTQQIIEADPLRLKQILINLLTNAIKFTPQGGAISLVVQTKEKSGNIRFIVEDNGAGITREDIGRLFQPFTQLDSSLTRQQDGSGLGLALVKQLVELHHGEVFVESQGIPGQGSCFTVLLPINQDHSGSQLPAHPLFPDPGSQDESGHPFLTTKGKLILLAEDNQANIRTIRDYLEMAGYRIIVAENGLEAIEMARNNHPDLILMDIQMPVMNGLDAIQYLRKDSLTSHTPIIALTALAMPGDRKRCLEAGADDYISKPINLQKLDERIGKMLYNFQNS